MTLIAGLEHQPRFPYEDLTDDNAALLELMLQNEQIVDDGHMATEAVSWVFNVAHPTVVSATADIYQETEHKSAINHRVKLFETMLLMVGTPPERIAPFAAERTSISLRRGKTTEELRSYTIDAVDNIRMATPNISEVVQIAAARLCGRLTHYALLGAAMTRQFEIDCIRQDELK